MTALRVRGWFTDGTITVPADVQGAIADMAADVRDLKAENDRLAKHSAALRALLRGITEGMDSDSFQDAYREALLVVQI